jgi:hypothetical protein
MAPPFPRIGLASRDNSDEVAARRVHDHEEPTSNTAIETMADLSVIPSVVNLDMTLGVYERGGHVRERKATLAETLVILGIVPCELHSQYSPTD